MVSYIEFIQLNLIVCFTSRPGKIVHIFMFTYNKQELTFELKDFIDSSDWSSIILSALNVVLK